MAKNLGISNLLDFYSAMLTDKQKEVAHLYFNEDLSLSEIAELLGITRQGVRDHIKKVETSLALLEERLRVAGNYSKMRTQCRQIDELIGSLNQYNRKYLFSAELTKRLKKVSELLGELLEEQVEQGGEEL
ncbi:MAG: HTH domain-containing protein [Oscillospiraceae bacterium]|jgi:predicted DNA-binding protein YlxM (UPF0122 family)|nr:HTH domain-containing protein [Oscillospiraceae bacterium]